MGMYGGKYVDGIDCQRAKDGLTKQSFKDQADINAMVEKYRLSGEWGSENVRQPVYADVSGLGDYQEACNVVIRARSMFDALPSKVRERFDNDPGKMVAFLSVEENRPEAERLGMLAKKPQVEPGAGVAPGGTVATPAPVEAPPGASSGSAVAK